MKAHFTAALLCMKEQLRLQTLGMEEFPGCSSYVSA